MRSEPVCVLILCVCEAAALSVDSQFGISSEDCFERSLIGWQLPQRAIYRNTSELTSRECEKLCRRDKQCRSYDYGVGAKGNATCNLSDVTEKDITENKIAQKNTDYDIHIRRFRCEQPPPKPLQPNFNDLIDDPEQKPSFDHEDQGLSERPPKPHDQNPSSNINAYHFRPPHNYEYINHRPNHKPSYHNDNDRPDAPYPDITEPDANIGYGHHKPTDIPFRPNYHNHTKPKPDPYDVLHFQHHYKPSSTIHYSENLRPDPPYQGGFEDDSSYGHKPIIDHFRPEKLSYQDHYYQKPLLPPITHLPEYFPNKPDHKHNWDNYGSSYNQRPETPLYGSNIGPMRPSYGGHSENHSGSHYIYLEINETPKPKPAYSHTSDNYYIKPDSGYQNYQPLVTHKPSQSYYGHNNGKPSYTNPSHDKPGYNKPSYVKPSYTGTDHNWPSYDYYKPSYNKPSYTKPEYGESSDTGYLRPIYEKPDYTQQSYNKPSVNKPSYEKPSYIKPSYGDNEYPTPIKPNYNIPSYTDSSYNKPGYDKPSYGESSDYAYPALDKPNYNKPSYSESSYEEPSYDKPNYDKPGYDKPSYDKPTYDKPSYGDSSDAGYSEPSYEQPDITRPSYNKPNHDHERPSYYSPFQNHDSNYVSSHHETSNSDNFNKDKWRYRQKPAYSYNKPQNYGHGYNHNYYEDTKYEETEYDKINQQSGYNNHTGYGYGDIPGETIKPVYESDAFRPANAPSYTIQPSGHVISSGAIAVVNQGGYGNKPSYLVLGLATSRSVCFRRVLAGKRAVRSHVRRVIPCERLEDCRLECANEGRFPCESFNYKQDPTFRGKGLCELMSKPIEQFDLKRDFVVDINFDFYEIDRNSLEPHCSDTKPIALHSGYLSKPSHGDTSYNAIQRFDDWGKRPGNYLARPGRRGYKNVGRRRFSEPYIPYQIGLPPPVASWGKYGGSYGNYDSYYKDRRDYYDSVKYWHQPDDVRDPYAGVRPHGGREMPGFDYMSLGPHNRNNRYNLENRYGYRDYNHIDHPSYDHHSHDHHSYGHNSNDHHSYGHNSNDHHSYGHNSNDHHSYGHNSNDHHSYDHDCDHCKLKPDHGSNGLDYGESNYHRPLPPTRVPVLPSYPPRVPERYPAIAGPEENNCRSQRRPGMALGSAAIRRSLLAQNVLECEAACFNEREFTCVSYSYRYSTSDAGADNCFLSERPYRGVAVSTEVGSDVYGMPHGNCPVHSPAIQTECFWHVRSNAAVSGWGAKLQLWVTGLGACEAECLRAQAFYCRGFSFRFNPPTPGEAPENCILTSFPPTSLEPGEGIRPSRTHELYARGNYGRGCESQLYDDPNTDYNCYLQYDKSARLIGPAIKGRAHVTDEAACRDACTGAPFTCLSFSYTASPSEGSDNCLLSEIRLYDLQLGVDYEHSPNDWLFAYELFNSHCAKRLHGPAVTSPGAAGLPVSGAPYLPDHPTGPPTGPTIYPETGPSAPGLKPPYHPTGSGHKHPDSALRPDYDPNIHGYTPDDHHLANGPNYGPERPGHEAHRPKYGPERPDYGPSGPSDGPGYSDRDDSPVPWGHYTVSGFPCRAGTTCAENRISGHWACEPEGGEIGSWDYCCAPTHRCGYSEGFNKPWCFVGPSHEQWRPCSDKYYPYHQHNVPHPSQGGKDPGFRLNRPDDHSHLNEPHSHRPVSGPGTPYLPDGDHKYWDDLYKNGPQAYYDEDGNPLPGYAKVPTSNPPHIRYHYNPGPEGGSGWQPVMQDELEPPQPGGFGPPRYWPVAYLHKGPPPNVTFYKYNQSDIPTNNYNKLPNPTKTTNTKNYTQEKPYQTTDVINKNENTTKGHFIVNEVKDFVNKTLSSAADEIKDGIARVSDAILNSTDLVDGSKEIEAKGDVKSEEAKSNGIDLKLGDLNESLEVLDIDDAKKGDGKPSDAMTLEAEERQIEAIGRLLANQRSGKLVLAKRGEQRLRNDGINVNKELVDFDFGRRYPELKKERKGSIQRVTKDDIQAERDNTEKSLETSETTYVRPPRILTTTDNIRKAIFNGRTFYDATLREQRDLRNKNTSLRNKNTFRNRTTNRNAKRNTFARQLDENRAPSLFTNSNVTAKNKIVRIRNVNPIRRVRRLYRRKYKPEEVRKRLLERDRMKSDVSNTDNGN